MASKYPTKPEAERVIRPLVHDWADEVGFRPESVDMPSYSDFKEYALQKGYGHYFKFRATGGSDYIAEMWFDQELKQTWRN